MSVKPCACCSLAKAMLFPSGDHAVSRFAFPCGLCRASGHFAGLQLVTREMRSKPLTATRISFRCRVSMRGNGHHIT